MSRLRRTKLVGIQVEDQAELQSVYRRPRQAERPVFAEGGTTCCYVRSENVWINDPQGVVWETFLTHGASPVYGHDVDTEALSGGARCSGQERSRSSDCC